MIDSITISQARKKSPLFFPPSSKTFFLYIYQACGEWLSQDAKPTTKKSNSQVKVTSTSQVEKWSRSTSQPDAALHALVDMQHAVAGRADVLHILTGVHAERDQAAGPNTMQRNQDKSYNNQLNNQPLQLTLHYNVQSRSITGLQRTSSPPVW